MMSHIKYLMSHKSYHASQNNDERARISHTRHTLDKDLNKLLELTKDKTK